MKLQRERERERELFSSRTHIPERRASGSIRYAFRRGLPKGGQRYSLIGGGSYGC